MEEPLFISVDKALAATDLGRTKFFELIAQKEIESVLVGRRRLIPWAALQQFCDRLREEARAEDGLDVE